jgi:hypothetical protein
MLNEFTAIQGCDTLTNFVFEPLIVIDIALHQVFNYLICTTSGSSSDAVEFVFHVRGYVNLHAISVVQDLPCQRLRR